MGKLGKALLHTGLLLLVLGIVAAAWLDRIVGRAVEASGSRALGVRTDVGSVQLRLLRGEVALQGLAVDNPEGFQAERFLQLGSAHVEVAPRSLLADTVVIPHIALQDIQLVLEGSRRGTNYGRLLGNIAASGSDEPAPAAAAGDAKRVLVEELVVRNVRATLALSGFGSQLGSASIHVPEIRLHKIGTGQGGLDLAELIARVTREVVQTVVSRRPELAAQLGTELRGRVETGARRAREELERLREGVRGVLPPAAP